MSTLQLITAALAVAVTCASAGAAIGYRLGRSIGPVENEAQNIGEAEEFATVLTAPVWTPPEREPLPPGVAGIPIGYRHPLVAEAFVGTGYGRHARINEARPCPVLSRIRQGPITQEIQRMIEEEREHVQI